MFTWNRHRLNRLCRNKDDAIIWCQSNGLIPAKKMCAAHGTEMSFRTSAPYIAGEFRCRKSGCKDVNNVAAARGTWFEGAKVKGGIPSILSITYSFANDDTYAQCRREAIELDDNDGTQSYIGNF